MEIAAQSRARSIAQHTILIFLSNEWDSQRIRGRVLSGIDDVRPDLNATIIFAARHNNLHEVGAPFDYARFRERLHSLRDAWNHSLMSETSVIHDKMGGERLTI
jgi:hypothetical protein